MRKIAAALLAASAFAGAFAPSVTSAASDRCLRSNGHDCDSHSVKFNSFAGTAKAGNYDPYVDGRKVRVFDPYADGSRQAGMPATSASLFRY
ncbi:hypothetical protein [Cupriavidus sp. CP313]